MFLSHLDLTTALRPVLGPDETLLFVQDDVGLYEGKRKIPEFQNGYAYLTSHRVCYVGHSNPREHSVAINLSEVDRHELHAGFIKSSPKISLFPKRARNHDSVLSELSDGSMLGVATRSSAGRANTLPFREETWICPICSFSNPVPSNFNAAAVTASSCPPCLACGVVPPLDMLKDAIAQATVERSSPSPRMSEAPTRATPTITFSDDGRTIDGGETEMQDSLAPSSSTCPRCTFINHPSLKSCEMCGATLPSFRGTDNGHSLLNNPRPESPALFSTSLSFNPTDPPESIKLSFRAGGDKMFYERLKNAIVQRKWLLQGAPPVPRPNHGFQGLGSQISSNGYQGPENQRRMRGVGLAGLQQRDLITRKNNEIILGTAFEDLEALMASAKQVVALAEKFSTMVSSTGAPGSAEASALVAQSASALGLMATKDVLGTGSGSETLYLTELSRNLAEFLTDDATGVLRREGGIMSLVDLWAVFNRARGGVELVSPLDFYKAASLWEKLKLPVRLRRFRSGLLVVQGNDRTDEKTVSSIMAWLRTLRQTAHADDYRWDVTRFGRGVTSLETAERFGWSVGVATEELLMAEERGAVCREESVEGLRFWENWFVDDTMAST